MNVYGINLILLLIYTQRYFYVAFSLQHYQKQIVQNQVNHLQMTW